MRRIELIGLAIPLGLVTGLSAWLLADGVSARASALEATHARLTALRAPAAGRPSGSGGLGLIGAPLFALTTGPGAVREPAIRLDGVSITRRRTAALVSIDARPSEWLEVGETRDGVSLQSLTSSSATFETALGVKSLGLGQQSAASAPLPGASGAQPVTAVVQDQPPPGFRSPPEPASAPPPR